MKTRPDVFVIGGGPAGLAAAIALRLRGMSVTVADGNQAPVDKACGEGLLPPAMDALEALGVRVSGHPLRGIRFISGAHTAQADFPGRPGMGVRRTELHSAMRLRAEELGAQLQWGTPAPREVEARWVIGADGATSLVRREVARAEVLTERRIARRQHFALAPWNDYVEVHWNTRGQVYVTPVSKCETGVAVITREDVPMEEMIGMVPQLGRGAAVSSRMRGAVTSTVRLARVTRGNVALIGDASGTVDAITGEGLGLAFRQALALARALSEGSPEDYEHAHRELAARPRLMSRGLTLLDRSDLLRSAAVRIFSAGPEVFAGALAFHIGG